MATYLATLLFHFQNNIDFENGMSFKSADASKLLQSFIANFRATVSKISVISDKTVVANNATLAKVSLYPYVIC
ncbi:hypothetical protein DLJ51_09555 [Streptococcus sobrinus]|uniref:Uncharacterized protein n=4 Tax=Streptococcus sobrinus TaxID=1310 RepID=A0ABM6W7E7_9STRE|nr:hypothetical protein DK181_09610 [Streptococcus sobrinus]AWN21599.1 hypothetical protein DK182_09835 [Streptococcus sobrinus]AWN62384.1 hypothetical protein DLJ52_09550 [Streptococcus sobrinus]AWN64259.1 hypothetical protein DLJ51_09555 [Streptococcus sobrinus]SQG14434.1 Uncharacterised protein [Streptococcus sobrinus]